MRFHQLRARAVGIEEIGLAPAIDPDVYLERAVIVREPGASF
jgi:hypothetical protein